MNDCCEKCADVDYEKTYPVHTATYFCGDGNCICHSSSGGEWVRFNEQFEKIFKEHHSTKMDVFLDRNGKSHYLLFKEDLFKLITQNQNKLTLSILSEVEEKRKDAKWFEDNYFTAENAFPTYDREKDRWVSVTAKETYNKALSDISTHLRTLLDEKI